MSTVLALQAELPEFDPLAALNPIRAEADWIGLRYSQETSHRRTARNGRPEQNSVSIERGVMIEALVDGQIAYAGTSDLSAAGIADAARRAAALARASARHKLFGYSEAQRPKAQGRYHSPRRIDLAAADLAGFTAGLIEATRRLRVSDRIVTAAAEANLVETELRYVSSNGSDISQSFLMTGQNFVAIAQDGGETQQRSLNGPTARCWQAGAEAYDWDRLYGECERVGREALELLDAQDCPNASLDLILAPDQMLLQIHESVGHPLELDRILGDERNYAGWSFVKPEDFGTLRYGSELMNIVFDPTLAGQFAAYAYDDGGHPARREYLIQDGLLLRGLGGLESQARSGLPGVANFRSASWNRAPIDRMANINLEPGASSLEAMIASVERGIYMEANRSWSIDDYRNKFQFGCEYARLIEDGRLTQVVKNPNYRGISVPFWRSLKAVGNPEEFRAYGTPYCGKGEPNQVIRVGHASPPCLFAQVEVFGGGA
ncbi:TldD/PmbA family protein [Methylomagnum ishizawai]|uniref:TldD/PmbA family protein n=1 Tax=Methylomagnum ishizawai TaxID=1760988 RepID=UPI001C32D8D5|nr:TldD/PmbA family protein [Methylomagnum ishizawai]BBL76780.1 peptidase C69 [Methylomagnum ishizawai]